MPPSSSGNPGNAVGGQPTRLEGEPVPAIAEGAGNESARATPGPSASPASIMTRERLDAILGHLRGRDGPSGHSEYQRMWREHLEERYLAKR